MTCVGPSLAAGDVTALFPSRPQLSACTRFIPTDRESRFNGLSPRTCRRPSTSGALAFLRRSTIFDSSTPLLQLGNSKLGRAIHVWSIPALETCPGSTDVCRSLCYALRHRFRFDSVKRRLDWNLIQSLRDDFVERMTAEIRAAGVLVLRLHVAGDFYGAEYVRKWVAIVKRSPRVRFFGYTRSWRIPALLPALEELAASSAMRLWYSADEESGVPTSVPPTVRIAYLQTSAHPPPQGVDLVFRPTRLRKLPASPLVCEHETPLGKHSGVTCGSCGRCFR